VLVESLGQQSSAFELCSCCSTARNFSRAAIRTPDLVDELMLIGRLRRRKTATKARRFAPWPRRPDQRHWSAAITRLKLMRIGLRDILVWLILSKTWPSFPPWPMPACATPRGRAAREPDENFAAGRHRTWQARRQELDYGARPGTSSSSPMARRRTSPSSADRGRGDGPAFPPDRTGVVFKTDTRLRPDGEKGLLVNTLRGDEEYYRHRAQLWEIQALTPRTVSPASASG